MSTHRGKILHLTPSQAIQRALSQIAVIPTPPPGSPADAGGYAIGYRLEGGFNGGDNPEAPHCASWSYGSRRPTADCVGFVLWAAGIDRMQPAYNGSLDVWLNCASLLDDAFGTGLPAGTHPRQFVRPLAADEKEQPGDFLLTRDHISMVLRPHTKDVGTLVVDCSPRHSFTAGINTGYAWSEACKVVRPLFYTGEPHGA